MNRFLTIFSFVAIFFSTACNSNAYDMPGPTLRQLLQSMDVAGIATLVPDGSAKIADAGRFRVEVVLKGNSLVKVGQEFQVQIPGPVVSMKRYLFLGVNPRELVLYSPIALTTESEKYVAELLKLPESQIERLAFFQEYFENADPILAQDSFDEFSLSPYEDVVKLKNRMNRGKLIGWVEEPSVTPKRKALYYTMLGVCGVPSDSDWMEKMLKCSATEDRTVSSPLIVAYLTLKGDTGLPTIVNSILKNADAQYFEIAAAVRALRFHSKEGNFLKQSEILKAMYALLDRRDLADMVILDLARMEDWSQLDRLATLYREAKEDNAWIRVPIVFYARICPLPEAKDRLREMETIDPAAMKRATALFSVVQGRINEESTKKTLLVFELF